VIKPEDWATWSVLLDEALELDAAARPAWLAALRLRDADAADAVSRLLQHESRLASAAGADLLQPPAAGNARADYDRALGILLSAGDREPSATAGQTFGPWQLIRRLGAGGMGEVWMAQRNDALYQGQAAIKLLSASGDVRRLSARFARERSLLARLNHPGIVRLLDAGISDDQPYLVLEYIDGSTLLDYAQQHAPSVAERVRLAIAIGRAVEHAHSHLIVHRDLKPSNVLVTADGQVKLLDFGIAALMDDDEATGLTRQYGRGLTLDYAAPEQIAGEATGVGCDVYSLGVLLFELLSGSRPFRGERPGRAALEYAVLHQEAPRLSRAIASATAADRAKAPTDAHLVSGDLEAIVAQALRKAPEDRYPTIAALVADLENWRAHRPVSARPGAWRYRSRLWLRRNRLLATLAAAVIVSLSAGLSVALSQWHAARAQTARAQAVSRFMSDLFVAADPERTRGEQLTARELVDAGAQRLIGSDITDPEIRAQLGTALGSTYVSLSRPDQAIPVLSDALANVIVAHGAEAPDSAQVELLLAKAEFQDEQYTTAASRYDRAVPALEAAGLGASEDVILGRNLWAYALAKQGDFERADRIIAETRARVLSVYGDTHWLYVETVNDTATLATIRGDWNTARTLLESIRTLMLTPPVGHRQDALTMRLNLANILARTGSLDASLAMLSPVVRDYTDLLSADANQTLVARWFLADTLKRTGQYAACAEEYKALAEARQRISGETHPLTVDVISKVAMCERLLGHRDQSRVWAQRARAALPASDDPPQRTVLRIASTLSALALDDGDAQVGVPLLERIDRLLSALHLETRDDMVWSAILHAYQQLRLGDAAAALREYESARTRAPAPMQTLTPLAYHAYLLALAGNMPAARTQLAAARSAASEHLPDTHPIALTLNYVATLIDGDATARAAALSALQGPFGLAPTLPLSPFWFGLI
jgi:serine/threonine protein kinase